MLTGNCVAIMKKEFNELTISNDKYDIYVTKKVFIGYTIKKFLKGTFLDMVQKVDINENLTKEELTRIATECLTELSSFRGRKAFFCLPAQKNEGLFALAMFCLQVCRQSFIFSIRRFVYSFVPRFPPRSLVRFFPSLMVSSTAFSIFSASSLKPM